MIETLFQTLVWSLSYLLPFLIVLTVIVFVHEMGHFLVARWNGVAVQIFSIGFGPELFGFTDRHGTRFRVSAVPLGGYVRFIGDMNAASLPDGKMLDEIPAEQRKHLFFFKNVWQRIAIIVAGPLANFVFTFLVLFIMMISLDRYVLAPVIDGLEPGGAAEQAGLMVGDRVVAVDNYPVRGFDDFRRLVATAPEREVTVRVERGRGEVTVTAVPDAAEMEDRFGNITRIGVIGVTRNATVEDYVTWRPDPVTAAGMAVEEMVFIVDRTFDFLGDFFVGRGDREQLGGPVKVAQVSGDVATLGPLALINLMALLSLNIGLFNLFPIPMLDGGHLVYYLAEAVRGRPLSRRFQEVGFRIGLALVFTLMVLTVVNDLV